MVLDEDFDPIKRKLTGTVDWSESKITVLRGDTTWKFKIYFTNDMTRFAPGSTWKCYDKEGNITCTYDIG